MKNARPTAPSIERVIQEHAPPLMMLDGVVGVYEGREEEGESVIRVMVASESRNQELMAILPERLEGYRVITEVTGRIKGF